MKTRGLWLSALLLMTACAPKAPAPAPVELPAGTKVSLLLMRRLDAGTAKVGSTFPLLVAEDVRAPDGTVVVQRGTPAMGTVTASRSEGSLSALMNRPARLEVTLDETRTVDGQTVRLRAQGEEAFAFSRANTGRPEPDAETLRVLDDPANAAAARAFDNLFTESAQWDEETKAALRQLTEALPPEARPQSPSGNDDPFAFVAKLQSGGMAAALADPTGSLAAVVGIANLAGSVGSRLDRMLSGRTIRAHVGTPVEAITSQPITIRPRDPRIEKR